MGTEKIGKFEYTVNLNDSPTVITAFNDLPIKTVNGTVIYMRDVAKVHDGSPPQTNVVHVDGKSGAGRALIEGIVALGRRHGWRRVYWPRMKTTTALGRCMIDSPHEPITSAMISTYDVEPQAHRPATHAGSTP